MIEKLTREDLVAEIEMVRAAFSGAILVVEGDGDHRLLNEFIDGAQCYIVIAHGKSNAIDAMAILESQNAPGLIAIVDADHWHLVGEDSPSPNVIVTEVHDVELLIFQSEAFESVVNQLASPGKVKSFLKKCRTTDLRMALLEKSVPIGLLRLISYEKGLFLRFKELRYKKFVDSSSLNIDVGKMANAVLNNTQGKVHDKSNIIGLLKARIGSEDYDRYQLCCGHDVTEIFAIGLKKALATKVLAIASKENVESVFRVAYHKIHFEKTQVYSSIRDWEQINPPYVVLKKE